MTNWICTACFAEFPATAQPPGTCPICTDPRQFVPPQGQAWTSAEQLAADGYRTEIREHEPGLYGIGIAPQIDIGKRALLVAHPEGGIPVRRRAVDR